MLRRFGREALRVAQENGDEQTELGAFRFLQRLDGAEATGEITDIPESHPVVKGLFDLVEVRLKVEKNVAVIKKRGGRRKKSELSGEVENVVGGNNNLPTEPFDQEMPGTI